MTYRDRQVAYGRWEVVYVDATPTREHIQTLRDFGFGFRRISDLSGVSHEILRGIAVGRGGYPPNRRVHRRNEQRILSVPLPPMREAYKLMAPAAKVDITGTRRRLRALMAIGYKQYELCDLISDSKLGNRILWTDRPQRTYAYIAARVVEVFDELQLVPGPSQRARNYAAKQGWHQPLAWDEDTIDDPDAEPIDCTSDGEIVRRNNQIVIPDFADVVADHRDLDRTNAQIAESLGMGLQTFERRLYRNGIPINHKGTAA
ncbi:hypothetical protein [Mycolicibacterium porcinum]|uniref:hypothetical protein n=1 Tax=Mycolicibacterium porcinum TaxID=39693 RepID=UPI001042520B|nr:hypothetical protein [Mycolicibacterium porcinum]